MNLCIDCSYAEKYSASVFYCRHLNNLSPVDGSMPEVFCGEVRQKTGFCGPEGKFFVARTAERHSEVVAEPPG